ncbi:RagB/SusD family nutrient uptake outer membrane protein [Saccharicrinis sp. GN24d3]|uniref:RagB/SusD family nutrient uptake outer membrane protein n=1 Tax=Saccharicrinis sp. GN24d3 TaxID=3458416 RepID=UPI0040352E23
MRRIICALSLFIILFSSCDDTFDINSNELLIEDDNFTTQEEVSANLVGIYALLQDISSDLVVLNDLRSNQLTVTEYADQNLKSIEKLQYDTYNPYCLNNKYYKLVNACNDFIHNAKGFLYKNQKADWDLVTSHIADVIKVRAWVYFNIAKIYGEIVYYTVPMRTIDDVKNDHLKQVLKLDAALQQLIADLTSVDLNLGKAIDWNAKLQIRSDFNVYDFHYNVLLGDLYLWSGDYENAANQFHKVINSNEGQYGLLKDLYDDVNYRNVFNGALVNTQNENINGIQFNEVNQQIFVFDELFNNNQEHVLQPTLAMIDVFESEDAISLVNKGDVYRGERCSYTEFNDGYKVTKYNGPKHFVFYRAAEVHLKYCEAKALQGELEIAYALLNDGIAPDRDANRYWDGDNGQYKPPFDGTWLPDLSKNHGVRERVGLKNKMYPNYASDAQYEGWTEEQITQDKEQTLLKWIFDESNLELCFEGKRYETALRFARREGDFTKYAHLLGAKNPAMAYESKLAEEQNWFINY